MREKTASRNGKGRTCAGGGGKSLCSFSASSACQTACGAGDMTWLSIAPSAISTPKQTSKWKCSRFRNRHTFNHRRYQQWLSKQRTWFFIRKIDPVTVCFLFLSFSWRSFAKETTILLFAKQARTLHEVATWKTCVPWKHFVGFASKLIDTEILSQLKKV